uniref:SH3_10 domain-containing protein n=1 Tax=Trichobilharzia regenti TaxID=157069 RepID=A0AA85JC13_TRIRE|nr:unnamed protein product [Trichobilharzia regenti]
MSESGATDDTLVGTPQHDVHYSSLQHERNHRAEQLRDICSDIFNDDIKDVSEQECMKERTRMLREHIEGNIEILDYLQGISGLEHDFTKLADRVVNTAMTLSDRNNVKHSDRIYSKDTGASVDKCWKYISQLSEAIQLHIMKSYEYHKLHHEIWAARMELQQVLSGYSIIQEKVDSLSLLTDESLVTVKKMIEAQLNNYARISAKSKEFVEKSCTITPIFLRSPLSDGKHSACLLASLRLPSGKWIHKGDNVKVWSSSPIASKLNNEWHAQTSKGEQLLNAPSICFWLTSPEHSPTINKRSQLMSSVTKKNAEDFDAFLSTKAVSKRFHEDLCSSWRIAVDLFANILIPTCKNYLKTLENVNPVVVEDAEEFSNILKLLYLLLEYGNDPALETVKVLSQNPLETEGDIVHVKNEDIQQLTETLEAWKTLLKKLDEAEGKRDENEASEHSDLNADVESSDINFLLLRQDSSVKKSEKINEYPTTNSSETKDGYEDKELVTSFNYNVPKTFKLNRDSSTCEEYAELPIKDSLHYHTTQKPSTNQSKLNKEKRELMTQIDTPFHSAVVYCPTCSEFHEISILSPFICNTESNYSCFNSCSAVSDALDGHMKPAQSMPSLLLETGNVGFDECKIANSENKRGNEIRKFLKSKVRNKSRPHSASASLTETTASSGLDSPSESSIIIKDEKESRQNRHAAHTRTQEKPKSKSSFLWWYKRSKSKSNEFGPQTPGSPYTEPGPPGRRSPLNIIPSELTQSSLHQSPNSLIPADKFQMNPNEDTDPVIRSYSWVQQGMPLGYGPPFNINWWPASHSSPQGLHPKNRRVNIRSERIKTKPRKLIRKHSFEKYSDRYLPSESHIYNTIDSGIQTDTDICTTGNLDTTVLDSASDIQQASTNAEDFCQYCDRRIHKVSYENNSVQCDFVSSHILGKSSKHTVTSSSSQTDQQDPETVRNEFKKNSIKVWNVSCQVGTVKRNQSTEPMEIGEPLCNAANSHINENEKSDDVRRYAKYNERPKSFESPTRRLTQLTLSYGARPVDPLKFSVSCQIGTSFKTAVDNAELSNDTRGETRKNGTIYHSLMCDASSFETTSPVMVGKKFQVNLPSAPQYEDVATQIEVKETTVNNLNVAHVKNNAQSNLVDAQSTFISPDLKIPRKFRNDVSNLVKATDCHGLVLLNETSTQIGLTNKKLYHNQKDSSSQTDLPYIYVTELESTSNSNVDPKKTNEKYRKEIYKYPSGRTVEQTIPQPATIDNLSTRSDHVKFITHSKPLFGSSSGMTYQSRAVDYQTDSLTNTQMKQVSTPILTTKKEIRSRTNESLPPCRMTSTLSKPRVRRNLTEIPFQSKPTNRRSTSTCGDLVMNIEVHGATCKRSVHEFDYLYTSKNLCDHRFLNSISSSSSSYEDTDDLCEQCRLKYYKPLQMNIAMKPVHVCYSKPRKLNSHLKSQHANSSKGTHRYITKRSFSADNIEVNDEKGDVINSVTVKCPNK